MEEYILEYLFQKSKDGLIKGNDYPLLLYLYEKSYHEGFSHTLNVTGAEVKEAIGLTKPTFKSCLENLEFAGLVTTESFSGRNGYTSVTLDFMEDIHKSSYLEANANQTVEDVLHRHCPNTKSSTQVLVKGAKGRKKDADLNWQELFHLVPVNSKESLQYRAEKVKKFYRLFFLNVKEFTNLDAKYKTSLPFKRLKYKTSLHFMTDAKSINIKDLAEVSDERRRNIRSFLGKSGTIYSSNIYILLNLLDKLLFNGNLIRAIEHYVIEDKSTKKTSNYHKKEFVLNEETKRHIPLKLHNHSETINGREVSFVEALQSWLDYKKSSGEPAEYNSILKNIEYLANWERPVASIENSIRSEWKTIYEDKGDPFNRSNGSSNDGFGSKKSYGTVRKFR